MPAKRNPFTKKEEESAKALMEFLRATLYCDSAVGGIETNRGDDEAFFVHCFREVKGDGYTDQIAGTGFINFGASAFVKMLNQVYTVIKDIDEKGLEGFIDIMSYLDDKRTNDLVAAYLRNELGCLAIHLFSDMDMKDIESKVSVSGATVH